MKFYVANEPHESKMRRREIRKKMFKIFLKTIEGEKNKSQFLICYLINQKL